VRLYTAPCAAMHNDAANMQELKNQSCSNTVAARTELYPSYSANWLAFACDCTQLHVRQCTAMQQTCKISRIKAALTRRLHALSYVWFSSGNGFTRCVFTVDCPQTRMQKGAGQLPCTAHHSSHPGEVHHAFTVQSLFCTHPPVDGGVGVGDGGDVGVGDGPPLAPT